MPGEKVWIGVLSRQEAVTLGSGMASSLTMEFVVDIPEATICSTADASWLPKPEAARSRQPKALRLSERPFRGQRSHHCRSQWRHTIYSVRVDDGTTDPKSFSSFPEGECKRLTQLPTASNAVLVFSQPG